MIKKKKNPIYVWWVGGRSCGAREPVPLGQFEVTPFKLISPLTPTLLRGLGCVLGRCVRDFHVGVKP